MVYFYLAVVMSKGGNKMNNELLILINTLMRQQKRLFKGSH